MLVVEAAKGKKMTAWWERKEDEPEINGKEWRLLIAWSQNENETESFRGNEKLLRKRNVGKREREWQDKTERERERRTHTHRKRRERQTERKTNKEIKMREDIDKLEKLWENDLFDMEIKSVTENSKARGKKTFLSIWNKKQWS